MSLPDGSYTEDQFAELLRRANMARLASDEVLAIVNLVTLRSVDEITEPQREAIERSARHALNLLSMIQ